MQVWAELCNCESIKSIKIIEQQAEDWTDLKDSLIIIITSQNYRSEILKVTLLCSQILYDDCTFDIGVSTDPESAVLEYFSRACCISNDVNLNPKYTHEIFSLNSLIVSSLRITSSSSRLVLIHFALKIESKTAYPVHRRHLSIPRWEWLAGCPLCSICFFKHCIPAKPLRIARMHWPRKQQCMWLVWLKFGTAEPLWSG